jgi:hypothetical protein
LTGSQEAIIEGKLGKTGGIMKTIYFVVQKDTGYGSEAE